MRAAFIIVGVMKSGTTTLAHHLHQHPQLAIPRDEVHFFDYDHIYAKGVDWYEGLFDACGKSANAVAGEKTPYSFYPYTAERIHAYHPGMKLLWIFRNPVDRAFSNYTHDLYNIDEWRRFERCIAQEEKRDVLYQYLSKGRYVEQVENYLRFFPKEQMRFVLFEDLLKQPEAELREVFTFLGVDATAFKPEKELHSKKSLHPRYAPALLYFYKKIIGQGGRGWNFLWRKNFSSPHRMTMQPATRERLLAYYRPYNERLATLTGKNFDAWNR